MKRKKTAKRTVLVVISALMLESLCGCGAKVHNVAEKDTLQKQQPSTVQEIMDYYSTSMKYGDISTRPAIKEAPVYYNTIAEESETYQKLVEAFNKISDDHQKLVGYEYMSEGLHNYLKAFTDDMVLSNGVIKRAKEFGGYYYLTVAYDVTKNNSGSFKNQANYLGIDGIIVKDQYELDKVDEVYLNSVVNKVNGYLTVMERPNIENYGSDPTWMNAQIQAAIENANKADESGEETEDTSEDTSGDTSGTSGEETGATGDVERRSEEDKETEDVGSLPLPNDPYTGDATNVAVLNDKYINSKGEAVEKVGMNNIDRLAWDIDFINHYVGSSKEQIAYMPDIDMVYNSAATQGTLNGFGMYSQGKAGLQDFGFAQNDIDNPGSIVVTYVFKQDILEPSTLNYVLAYVNEFNSNNESIKAGEFGGVFTEFVDNDETEKDEDELMNEFTGPSITVPTFLNDQIGMILDEFDRAVNDRSIVAFMDGTVIEDAGLGLHYAAYSTSADIVTFKSALKRIVARKGNEYLLEVERTVEDTPKNCGVVGQYRDTYFVVVRQDGVNFKYNDEFFVRRIMTQTPEVAPENTAIRRLVTLNLSGSVDTNTAKDITDNVLNKLASDMTARAGDDNGPAYYKLFNTDTNLLSSERFSYLTSKILGQANSKGSGTAIEWTIKPTEWISGSEQQVEFTTKELVKYSGGKLGALYIENYYLVSKYGTEWKIDDIISIKDQYINAEDVANVEADVNSTVAVITEDSIEE